MSDIIRCKLWILILVLLCVGTQAFGQSDRATITGTVTDTSGAVVPNATVTAVDPSTKAAYTTTTNGNGVYSIPGLPLGVYTLKVEHAGFQGYVATGIAPEVTQVMQVNAHLEVGSTSQTVMVSGGVPLLETQTSNEATTMEETAIQELPLNAYGGRSATQLILSTTPNVGANWSWSEGGQSWVNIAGGETMSNAAFIDGVDATTSNQGSIASPGQDALAEMQIQTVVTDAQLSATGGGALLYELKSGTNQLHGSAFEFLQNEDLSANTWSNNQFKSACAPGDSACTSQYARAMNRFNDFGGSAGGPIWKNHTFIFGDFEYYSQSNWTTNPTGATVPTAKMLAGDFSDLLTGGAFGANAGPVMIGGVPQVNPCTGQPYLYGQIMDPSTSQVVGGAECATPFAGNVIPSGRISPVSQKMAAIYSQYYKPTVNRLVGGNFPTVIAGQPQFTKKTFDVKIDHNFSEKHHVSASLDLMNDVALENFGPFSYQTGPFASFWTFGNNNYNTRIIDTYFIKPTLTNTFAIGYGLQQSPQVPKNHTDVSSFGLPAGNIFPNINFQSTNANNVGGSGVNGVATTSIGAGWDLYMNYNAYHYQDTLAWQKGQHSLAFGGEFTANILNSANYNQGEQQYNFQNYTGGPVDPSLTPWVGSSFANMMLGDANFGQLFQRNVYYPRQKTISLFAQDDIKVTPKLTLNVGLNVNETLAGHMANGKWENFDLTATNPNWAPYKGAWIFSQNSGTTFENNNYIKFGPHFGGAYQVTSKLVARASYGLFYIPLGAFSSGGADYYPANQDPLNAGLNQELTNVVGGTVFNWSNGYPGTTIFPVQNSTATTFGDSNRPMYIAPDTRNLGHTQTFYAGVQYGFEKNMVLDVRYVGNRGGNLHDYGHSVDQSWPLNFNQYQSLLLAGKINAPISNAADAAALGVPYPYAGFTGPAYAAIAPYPQIAAPNFTTETIGLFSQWAAVSAYNSFVVELNVRKSHGLYADWSFVVSKQTSNQNGMDNFSNNWGSMFQSPTDSVGSSNWVATNDQRYLSKGYLTYDLPFGRNGQWLSNSGPLDYAVGGWTIGFYGSYGSGLPFGVFNSTYQLPYYYSGNQRASFANGATATNMKNQFHGHLNLLNPTDSANFDFSPSSFAATTPAAPFGDTPRTWNHFRWNPGPAQENVSILKHFGFGPDGKYRFEVGGEFYDVFNRHYYNAPDTYMGDSTFGDVRTVNGVNRVGQLRARFQF